MSMIIQRYLKAQLFNSRLQPFVLLLIALLVKFAIKTSNQNVFQTVLLVNGVLIVVVVTPTVLVVTQTQYSPVSNVLQVLIAFYLMILTAKKFVGTVRILESTNAMMEILSTVTAAVQFAQLKLDGNAVGEHQLQQTHALRYVVMEFSSVNMPVMMEIFRAAMGVQVAVKLKLDIPVPLHQQTALVIAMRLVEMEYGWERQVPIPSLNLRAMMGILIMAMGAHNTAPKNTVSLVALLLESVLKFAEME